MSEKYEVTAYDKEVARSSICSSRRRTKPSPSSTRSRIPAAVEAAIASALQQGRHGIHKIAAKHSIGVGVVQRIKASMAIGRLPSPFARRQGRYAAA